MSRIQPFFAVPDPNFFFLMDPGPHPTENKIQELSFTSCRYVTGVGGGVVLAYRMKSYLLCKELI